eukprot:369112-Rhodomonas_salina.1
MVGCGRCADDLPCPALTSPTLSSSSPRSLSLCISLSRSLSLSVSFCLFLSRSLALSRCLALCGQCKALQVLVPQLEPATLDSTVKPALQVLARSPPQSPTLSHYPLNLTIIEPVVRASPTPEDSLEARYSGALRH